MYAKLFEQVFNSSLADNYLHRLVFMDMLILADSDGVVDMTHQAIARRTNVPIETVCNAIEALESADDRSRSKECNGARIQRLDDHRNWGWFIVNYQRYRMMATEENRKEKTRDRVRKHRALMASDATKEPEQKELDVTASNASETKSNDKEKDMDMDMDTNTKKNVVSELENIHQIEEIYNEYPRRVGKPAAIKAICKALRECGFKELLGKTQQYATARAGTDMAFTPHASTWFNQQRFNDDPSTWRAKGSTVIVAKPVIQESKPYSGKLDSLGVPVEMGWDYQETRP